MEFKVKPHLKGKSMSKQYLVGAALLLAGCAQQQPDAPPPPKQIGMANPASVYCVEKGGKLIAQKSAQGESNLCQLPGGERVDEWTLWRRDHPQKQ